MAQRERILVRATIQLPGLRLGDFVLADPDDPYTADCIEAGYLVPEDAVTDRPEGYTEREHGTA